MDIIYIRNLETRAIIGIRDQERTTPQTLRVNLEMGTDIRAASASEAVEDTLDYSAISRETLAFIDTSQFYLIETLAEHLARRLLEMFPIRQIKVQVSKPEAVPAAEDVGVVIERSAEPR